MVCRYTRLRFDPKVPGEFSRERNRPPKWSKHNSSNNKNKRRRRIFHSPNRLETLVRILQMQRRGRQVSKTQQQAFVGADMGIGRRRHGSIGCFHLCRGGNKHQQGEQRRGRKCSVVRRSGRHGTPAAGDAFSHCADGVQCFAQLDDRTTPSPQRLARGLLAPAARILEFEKVRKGRASLQRRRLPPGAFPKNCQQVPGLRLQIWLVSRREGDVRR
mmetsp:Transcript_24326/g.67335  ORF Transcript_24326/g.67335 Transcript_24326/m.67335 type:complete len:216 (-) Transcript_24326:469-1116(-)